MEVLSDILSSIKAYGSIYFCDKLDPPWQLDERDRYQAAFHYVRAGQCWLHFEGEQHLLGPGDLVFVGQGDAHQLASFRDRAGADDFAGATHLLCGYFGFRDVLPEPLTASMPSCLILRAEQVAQRDWLKTTLEHLSAEYRAQSPGADVVLNKLTEVVLIELIRSHLDRAEGDNFVAALFDKQIGKALKLIHEHPEQSWTLDRLSEQVAMSRAVFAKRFKSLVGQPMFAYLSALRMRKASELLRHSDASVADIAEAVGYQSDMAFSRVFKEHFAHTPYAWRKAYRSEIEANTQPF